MLSLTIIYNTDSHHADIMHISIPIVLLAAMAVIGARVWTRKKPDKKKSAYVIIIVSASLIMVALALNGDLLN